MGTVETEGLILRTYSLGDADKIVVLLTKDDGLVRGVAKGAKRLRSRFGSGLEPFSVVRVSYFRKEERELVSITAAELERSFFFIASDPDFFQSLSYASELLQAFAPPHDPNERLYNMTRICLETAAESRESTGAVMAYFEIWLLKLGGFLPSWDTCASCRQALDDQEASSLLPDFGISCSSCESRGVRSEVSPVQRSVYRKAQKTSPEKFAEFTARNASDLDFIAGTLRRMIARILNKEVRNKDAAYGG